MKKIYVLDTNVLLQDPRALFAFEDNEIIIPAVVLEEIDAKKRYTDEIGKNARYVAKLIDSLRSHGQLHSGIKLESGGNLRVELNHRSFNKMQDIFLDASNDNRILAVAMNLREEEEAKPDGCPVIIVSKDALVRVKADALGLQAEDFLSDRVIQDDELYKGYVNVSISQEIIGYFYKEGRLSVHDYFPRNAFYPHQFIIFRDECGSSSSALGKVNGEGTWIEPLYHDEQMVWGIRPRNAQQKMAIELLLNERISLITMTGKAGTGKTLLSLACGLHLKEDEGKFHKLLVAKPVVPVGKDIGYLPGEKEEKLRPWMQPIYDNLEYLFNTKQNGDLDRILSGMGNIQVEALTYIRGRSIPEQYIIVDEAQNLTKHEVKTILTRVGEGSKIVLMGDPDQIDHPYLDKYNNGLSYVVERFKEQKVSGHIHLEKGERSHIAQLAADLL
ncbi:PhoH family protein [Microaerobacter geothermalis]|uniref:PhoH family protein n=1 Tax=Microaerobacter geothermalis TaxID=674972 RepID=UPI001F46EEF1|nr:PhoH family protein [Microaerobacter geothermalis]MCF6093556.1 PhoH family protein [Microaerobacter geothermalis]